MAKIQIKSEKLTPFGGFFGVMEHFNKTLGSVIDNTLGKRCTLYGFQYSEIVRSLMCVYFCGGSCVEDVTSHLMRHLSLHPSLRTCSADTILRAFKELAVENTTYVSESGKSYDFNIAERLNRLLLNALMATGELKAGGEYDFDFDHQYIETGKYDANAHCKHFYIRANRCASIYDDLVSLSGWNRLPKSFMDENTAFLLLTALIHNFYRGIIPDSG